MRKINESEALARLKRIKDNFRAYIGRHSQNAIDCSTCSMPCCQDSKFVNVNITRLEATAILRTLQQSPRISKQKFYQIITKAEQTVVRHRLDAVGDTFKQTYSCPLFEKGVGCLVHYKAKPAPCIQFGCYEDWQDIPDMTEFHRVQRRVERLHEAIGEEPIYQTIPVWLKKLAHKFSKTEPELGQSTSGDIVSL
ncbi:MAG TPA: hypothetical protein VFC63_20960 [Blastocatellia bacterium]|nr:hypothetical protein [Blastocatellia bacterium]